MNENHEIAEDEIESELSIGGGDDRGIKVAFLANNVCERVSLRFAQSLALKVFTEAGRIPCFIHPDEAATYGAACRYLAKLFFVTSA